MFESVSIKIINSLIYNSYLFLCWFGECETINLLLRKWVLNVIITDLRNEGNEQLTCVRFLCTDAHNWSECLNLRRVLSLLLNDKDFHKRKYSWSKHSKSLIVFLSQMRSIWDRVPWRYLIEIKIIGKSQTVERTCTNWLGTPFSFLKILNAKSKKCFSEQKEYSFAWKRRHFTSRFYIKEIYNT